jgi:hypothetical protein
LGTKKGFFDFDEAAADEEPVIPKVKREESAITADSKNERRFRRGSVIAVSVLAVILAVLITLSGIDFITDGELNGIFGGGEKPTTYKLYDPDWETDIYTVPAYLELDPDAVMYSSDGFATVLFYPDDMPENSEIAFINSYFDAIKHGDHEKLNSMFGEEYLSEKGAFEDFPMQKVYNIKVVKQPKYEDQKYENTAYDYCYYALTYNIYRNDGLFCDEVDETHAREEGILVVYTSKGQGKIVKRIDAKYVIN